MCGKKLLETSSYKVRLREAEGRKGLGVESRGLGWDTEAGGGCRGLLVGWWQQESRHGDVGAGRYGQGTVMVHVPGTILAA